MVIIIEHPKHLSQRSQSKWTYVMMSNKLAIPILVLFACLRWPMIAYQLSTDFLLEFLSEIAIPILKDFQALISCK